MGMLPILLTVAEMHDSLIIVNVAGTFSWDVTEALTAAESIAIMLNYCECCRYIELGCCLGSDSGRLYNYHLKLLRMLLVHLVGMWPGL